MFSLDLGNLLVHLGLNTTAFDQPIEASYAKVQQVSAKMSSLGGALERKVTAPLVAFATLGLHGFAKFDEAMTKSLAIFRGVSDDLRTEMAQTAKDMSLKSEASATELAKAYFFLGSAGYSAEQSLQLLGVAERFAMAGSFDLSTAVTLAADSQKALGLSFKDPIKNAESLTRITDILVGVNTLANANTLQFAQALTNEAGPAMKAWNIQLEEGVAVLAAYADQGTKGEKAGSDFSRMLRFLMQGFRENNAEWVKFGVNIFDTAGNLRPLADIIEDLSVRLDGMSAKTKSVQLDLLGFKARSQQVILPLLDTQDAIRGYLERLKEMQGLTAEIAEENLKNFYSRMVMVWHTIQSLAGDIGRILSPYMLQLGEYIKRVNAAWRTLNDHTKLAIVQFAMYAAVLGPALVVTAKLLSTIGWMSIGFTALKTAIIPAIVAIAGVLTPVLGVIAAVAAVAGVVYALRAAWIQNFEVVKNWMEDFVNAISDGWVWLTKDTGKFLSWFTKAFIDAWAYLRSSFTEFFADLISGAGAAATWISKIVEAIKNAWTAPDISSMINEMKFGAKAAGDAWAQAFTDTWDKSYSDVKKFSAEAYDVSKEYAGAFREATVEALEEWRRVLVTQIGADAQSVIDAITVKINKMTANKIDLLPREDADELQKRFDKLSKTLKNSIAPAADETSDSMQEMLDALDMEMEIIGQVNKGYERGADIIEFKHRAMKKFYGDTEKVNAAVDEYIAKLEELGDKQQFSALRDWMRENNYSHLWENLSEDAARGLDDLSSTITDFITGTEVDWKQFCASILKEFLNTLVRMQTQQIITSIATAFARAGANAASAGAGSAGSSGGGAAQTQFDYQVGSYMGNAFDSGRVVAMSMGGIVPTPTVVPMADGGRAYIAEREPEAVAPLVRTRSGRLGIRMEGGNDRQIINKLKVVNVMTREEQLAAMQSEAGEKIFTNYLRRVGVI